MKMIKRVFTELLRINKTLNSIKIKLSGLLVIDTSMMLNTQMFKNHFILLKFYFN